MMSMLRIGIGILIISTLLASCKQSANVVHNGLIQKRKHLNGFHLNMKFKNKDVNPPIEWVDSTEAIASQEYPSDPDTVFLENGHGATMPSEGRSIYPEKESHPSDGHTEAHNSSEKGGFKAFLKHRRALPFHRNHKKTTIDDEPRSQMDPRTAGVISIVLAVIPLLIPFPFLNILCAGVAMRFGKVAMQSDDVQVQTLGQIGRILGIVSLIYSIVLTLFVVLYFGFIFLLILSGW